LGLDINIAELEKKGWLAIESQQPAQSAIAATKSSTVDFRHMLTGTYRENMKDFDRMRRDFAAWLRKVRAVVPHFRSVWAFEPQKRGAWHFHATTDALPRFCVIRALRSPPMRF
jgi:hypothetical protein